jgi:hypothetical protein
VLQMDGLFRFEVERRERERETETETEREDCSLAARGDEQFLAKTGDIDEGVRDFYLRWSN